MHIKERSKLDKVRIWFIRLCLLFFYTLFVAASVRNVVESGGEKYFGSLAPIIDILSDVPSIVKNELFEKDIRIIADSLSPHHFNFKIIPQNTKAQLLVPSYDYDRNLPICNLYDLDTGKSIKKWSLPEEEVKSERRFLINQNSYFGHPLMLIDSSIIFYTRGFLARLDKNEKILWKNNLIDFHHSLEQDSHGNIWACFTEKTNNYYPPLWKNKLKNYKDDGIIKIDSETGMVLFKKSITQMLIENNYVYLVDGIGKVEEDQIHVNDVQPVLVDSKYWKEGDVFISIRNRSTIILYRPSTNKIIWLKTGPWVNQHDVDILDDSRISVFGNDAAIVAIGIYKHLFTSSKHNNIYVFNFESNSISMPYHRIMEKTNISTKEEGGCEILTNGDVLIDETRKGKVYLLDTSQIKFTFSERIDEKHIYMLPWVRYIEN